MGEETKAADAKKDESGTVTEDDLLKSLTDLEGKKPDEDKKPEADPKVETAALEKNAADAIKDGASDDLKKSLDVSSALSEITSLLGAHVDDSLEALQKSVDATAQRDLKFVAILEGFQKSIGELAEKIAEFGGQPAKKPSAKVDDGKVEVLKKSIEGDGSGDGDDKAGNITRIQVLGTMERLAKSADIGSDDNQRWTNAAVKFESTGQISNKDLLEIRSELAQAA